MKLTLAMDAASTLATLTLDREVISAGDLVGFTASNLTPSSEYEL